MSNRTASMMLTVCIAEEIEKHEAALDGEEPGILHLFKSVFYRGAMAGALAALRVSELGETAFEAMEVVQSASSRLHELVEEDEE